MRALDDIGLRKHFAALRLVQRDRHQRLMIDAVDLFAHAQVVGDRAGVLRGDSVSDAIAHAATIEAKHKSWPCWRAAMIGRVDAKAAAIAGEPCRHRFFENETWPPHERAVSEDP